MHRVHKWWYPRMEEGRVSNEADNLLVGSDGKTTCKTDTGTHREKIVRHLIGRRGTQTVAPDVRRICLLYTSDAADDLLCVDLGGRRIIKKKNKKTLD